MWILFISIAANLLLTVLYGVRRGVRREGFGMILLFLFLPALGFLIYYLPALPRSFLEMVRVNREAVLTHAFEVERQPEHPDVREALDVVPVEDAMAVSGNTEKRALLLKQLKKDLKENYKILLAAEQDEDSESAHYVAAARMEIYRLGQARWLECRRDHEREPGDPEKYHAACEALMDLLSSGVLSPREQSACQKRLCALVQGQIDREEGRVTLREYEEYLGALVELGRYRDAELLWQEAADRMRSETAYREMLKMFYRAGDRQRFGEILDDLCGNRQVRLSPKGLEQLRYWLGRLAGPDG